MLKFGAMDYVGLAYVIGLYSIMLFGIINALFIEIHVGYVFAWTVINMILASIYVRSIQDNKSGD